MPRFKPIWCGVSSESFSFAFIALRPAVFVSSFWSPLLSVRSRDAAPPRWRRSLPRSEWRPIVRWPASTTITEVKVAPPTATTSTAKSASGESILSKGLRFRICRVSGQRTVSRISTNPVHVQVPRWWWRISEASHRRSCSRRRRSCPAIEVSISDEGTICSQGWCISQLSKFCTWRSPLCTWS